MTPNPLIELARTLVALRALARDLGIEWELVQAAADKTFEEADANDTELTVRTEGN